MEYIQTATESDAPTGIGFDQAVVFGAVEAVFESHLLGVGALLQLIQFFESWTSSSFESAAVIT